MYAWDALTWEGWSSRVGETLSFVPGLSLSLVSPRGRPVPSDAPERTPRLERPDLVLSWVDGPAEWDVHHALATAWHSAHRSYPTGALRDASAFLHDVEVRFVRDLPGTGVALRALATLAGGGCLQHPSERTHTPDVVPSLSTWVSMPEDPLSYPLLSSLVDVGWTSTSELVRVAEYFAMLAEVPSLVRSSDLANVLVRLERAACERGHLRGLWEMARLLDT